MGTPSGGITIAALPHDLIRKRSTVTLVWDAEPEKSVVLFRFGAVWTKSAAKPKRR